MPSFSTDACGTQIGIGIDAPCSTKNERVRHLQLVLGEEKRSTGSGPLKCWTCFGVAWLVLCLPVGSSTNLWLEFIAERGMADRQGRGLGEGGDWGQGEFGDLDKIS